MPHIYEHFIDQVAKPARYLGGEYLSVVKQPTPDMARVVMAFPDVYEIGMSHMGTKILYSVLNKDDRIWCERSFTPWTDMEAELRERELPLVSLESSTPLSEFDVVGMSLQYELTFTNVLTLLDLGGIPLRSADRDQSHPLIIGGGPIATHPEPMAPFFDAFFVGEGESELPDLVADWTAMRRAGTARREALIAIAAKYPVYVPSLYAEQTCPDTGMTVVGAPLDPRVPDRVRRGLVQDLNKFPFPSDSPVPYAEAVFDRAGVEIARGCTEGCRFCQAGMIYRPVRERSPESIVESVIGGVENAGYDETSLTSLSTADYSCITPLVKTVMSELSGRKVSLSVSSLRAYGLGPAILDEMAQMRITGLTFAPEAGTQRMRDVVNKNVTEAHITESSERVFERGWARLKLYFMIGLPTEQDEDVVGIVETGERMLAIGRRHVGGRANVTVSVSSHVPKPHTPFQWCAQDPTDEIIRKQKLLRSTVRQRNLRLKYHDCGISFVEGVVSRGDRRLSDAIELSWNRGARFDSWDEHFDLKRWQQAFSDCGVDTREYLGTRPISARLPWDHIDVGLDDGFLLTEYRRSLKDRLSPPCGKVVGQLIHHDNLVEATADHKKLVCYDCGVACDLTDMRSERLVYLRTLGAEGPVPERAPVRRQDGRGGSNSRHPVPRHPEVPLYRYRLRYTKLGRTAFLGHLDTSRVLSRLFRRAHVEIGYSRGFHPKPSMQFSPALSLGVPSLGELVDVALEDDLTADELRDRLTEVCPEGLQITGVWRLSAGDPKLSKLIDGYELAVVPAEDGMVSDSGRLSRIASAFLSKGQVHVMRPKKNGPDRQIDVRGFIDSLEVVDGDDARALCAALDWDEAPALLRARVRVSPDGSAKPIEVARGLAVPGADRPGATGVRIARLGFGVAAPGSRSRFSGSGSGSGSVPLSCREIAVSTR